MACSRLVVRIKYGDPSESALCRSSASVVHYREDELYPMHALRILESLLPSEQYARRIHSIVISDECQFGWIEYGANSVPGGKSADQGLFGQEGKTTDSSSSKF